MESQILIPAKDLRLKSEEKEAFDHGLVFTPNLLKIGRLHSRALDGPVRFPTGPKDLMVKVEQAYDAFFKIWNATMVPKLLPQPKWFKESPKL